MALEELEHCLYEVEDGPQDKDAYDPAEARCGERNPSKEGYEGRESACGYRRMAPEDAPLDRKSLHIVLFVDHS